MVASAHPGVPGAAARLPYVPGSQKLVPLHLRTKQTMLPQECRHIQPSQPLRTATQTSLSNRSRPMYLSRHGSCGDPDTSVTKRPALFDDAMMRSFLKLAINLVALRLLRNNN